VKVYFAGPLFSEAERDWIRSSIFLRVGNETTGFATDISNRSLWQEDGKVEGTGNKPKTEPVGALQLTRYDWAVATWLRAPMAGFNLPQSIGLSQQ
jgi:hypothetical protein